MYSGHPLKNLRDGSCHRTYPRFLNKLKCSRQFRGNGDNPDSPVGGYLQVSELIPSPATVTTGEKAITQFLFQPQCIELPPKEATLMSREVKYIGMDLHKEAIVIAVGIPERSHSDGVDRRNQSQQHSVTWEKGPGHPGCMTC
jgi:hypothetical protein